MTTETKTGQTVIYQEGGINWTWYTELRHNENDTVTIIRHWRVHNGELGHPEGAVPNLNSPYKEEGARIAVAYEVLGRGLLPITNKQYIFDYPSR